MKYSFFFSFFVSNHWKSPRVKSPLVLLLLSVLLSMPPEPRMGEFSLVTVVRLLPAEDFFPAPSCDGCLCCERKVAWSLLNVVMEGKKGNSTSNYLHSN